MAVGWLDKETVKLFPGQISMEQDKNMAIFWITNWNLDKKSKGEEGLEMSISMHLTNTINLFIRMKI